MKHGVMVITVAKWTRDGEFESWPSYVLFLFFLMEQKNDRKIWRFGCVEFCQVTSNSQPTLARVIIITISLSVLFEFKFVMTKPNLWHAIDINHILICLFFSNVFDRELALVVFLFLSLLVILVLLPFLNFQPQIGNISFLLIKIFSFFWLECFLFSNWNMQFLFYRVCILIWQPDPNTAQHCVLWLYGKCIA